jgi:hypothetical protein
MSVQKSLTIVDDQGRTVIEISQEGITFTADNGGKALLRLRKGTDSGSLKFELIALFLVRMANV